MLKHLVHFSLFLLLALCSQAVLSAPSTAHRYRDLKIYTTSAPDAKNPAKIIAVTQFVNEGQASMTVKARLKPSRALKISGGGFSKTLPAGKNANWQWTFLAPAGFTSETLTGFIDIDGKRERDLYIAVLGADPADFTDERVEKIDERARVVATHAPRTAASIQAEMKALDTRRPAPALTLAAGGDTAYAILVEALPATPEGEEAPAYWRAMPGLSSAQQNLIEAVDDLGRCIKIQSGAVLPIRAMTAGPAIILRLTDPGEAAKGLQDAYRLRTAGGNVLIEAKDAVGLRNGIYGLLTDHLDCHWYQPRQLGEEIVIPPDSAVRLPELDEVKGSKWFSAAGASWGNGGRWDVRNRGIINGGRMTFGHSWSNYVGKNEYPYEKFPDYYARDRQGNFRLFEVPGASSMNFCSTNPEVIEIVARKINAFFTANPDAIVASLDPNDSAPMCLCDRCLALDRQYGQTSDDGAKATDRLLHFSGQIYDRLEPQFKDRYLGILMYAYQMDPPVSAKPHPHHAGLIVDETRFDHSRPWNDPTSKRNHELFSLIKEWGSIVKQLGYYDYYGMPGFYGPWGIVHKIREDMAAFHDLGGTFLFFEAQPIFAMQGLNHYVTTRLEWNIDADVDLLVEDYLVKYYGPAAEPMRKFCRANERWYALERPGASTVMRVPAHPEFWTELAGYLREARQAVANLPAADSRFVDRVMLISDGFDYGRFRYDYDARFGGWRSGPVDHAAAIEFLRDNSARMAAMQQKYSTSDTYWPTLIPAYFCPNYDGMIQRHQDALKKE